MPCDQILLNQVSLENFDRQMFKRALANSGIRYEERRGVIYARIKGVDVQVSSDRVGMRDGKEWVADEIRQMVSKRSIEEAAEETGWDVTFDKDENGLLTFELSQETF